MEDLIVVKNLTKDYGSGRGIFDVTFEIHKGEVFGFLGPNGAGKTTTMRHLMGFSKPQKGHAQILNKDCWKEHDKIMKNVGYLPGEVNLPDSSKGTDFIELIRKLRKQRRKSDYAEIEKLIKIFDINLDGNVKKMSIGEKRKLAILSAFMSNPDVLLLDEPTSGLDPLMQEKFIEYVKGQKQKGKTILLSSHIFNEVEALCDRIAIIKEGKIISLVNTEDVKHFKRKTYEITFYSEEDYQRFKKQKYDIRYTDDIKKMVGVGVDDGKINELVKDLRNYKVLNFIEHKQTLEDYFMHFYKSEKSFEGVKKRGR